MGDTGVLSCKRIYITKACCKARSTPVYRDSCCLCHTAGNTDIDARYFLNSGNVVCVTAPYICFQSQQSLYKCNVNSEMIARPIGNA